MTDNTQNTKQCDREVDLTSPGIMTLTSQLGLAPIPHTFFYFHHRREYSRPSRVHFPIEIMRYGNDLWARLTDYFCCEVDVIRYYYYYYYIEPYSIIASKYHHAVNIYSVISLNLSNPHKASVRRPVSFCSFNLCRVLLHFLL